MLSSEKKFLPPSEIEYDEKSSVLETPPSAFLNLPSLLILEWLSEVVSAKNVDALTVCVPASPKSLSSFAPNPTFCNKAYPSTS